MLQHFRDATFSRVSRDNQRSITRLALQQIIPSIQPHAVFLLCSTMAFNAAIKQQWPNIGLEEVTSLIGVRSVTGTLGQRHEHDERPERKMETTLGANLKHHELEPELVSHISVNASCGTFHSIVERALDRPIRKPTSIA
jgi:hypothetical protein